MAGLQKRPADDRDRMAFAKKREGTITKKRRKGKE